MLEDPQWGAVCDGCDKEERMNLFTCPSKEDVYKYLQTKDWNTDNGNKMYCSDCSKKYSVTSMGKGEGPIWRIEDC